jgi:hypothetical protein
MKTKIVIFSCVTVAVVVGCFLAVYLSPMRVGSDNESVGKASSSSLFKNTYSGQSTKQVSRQDPLQTVQKSSSEVNSLFLEDFFLDYTIKEVGSVNKSASTDWWVSSGGYFYSANGTGRTIKGSLPSTDPWRVAYSISNQLDTDNGYYPQNIFRLIEKGQWKNFQQEMYFKILNNNFSGSPNRNASNGILLFNRYQDEFNLYYTGIRVDGYAVIKKKIKGVYYTLAYSTVYPALPYERVSNQNAIPIYQWIGLRSVIQTGPDGTVSIKVYIDKNKTGNWVLVAEGKDDGKSYGGSAITNAGYAGIRTDFMDVEFDNYNIESI